MPIQVGMHIGGVMYGQLSDWSEWYCQSYESRMPGDAVEEAINSKKWAEGFYQISVANFKIF